MFFNPLFMQTTEIGDPANNIKQVKLNKDSYLFSDIIKLNYEKSKVDENDLLGTTGLGELESAVSSGAIIEKEELLDQFVGMPNLQMFTIVEPKVLNSLVEKVFQSESMVENTNEFFVLNKNVDVDHDLKSEIYGSEEKLVQFLEQLLPGMALVDTSKSAPSEAGDKTQGNNDGANLHLLPLPGKENVVQDVLKRLKAGETIQITAKVGEEKIKLDITKVSQVLNNTTITSPDVSGKLAAVTPSNETASNVTGMKSYLNNVKTSFDAKNEGVSDRLTKELTGTTQESGVNFTVDESNSKFSPNSVDSNPAALSAKESNNVGAVKVTKAETVNPELKVSVKSQINADKNIQTGNVDSNTTSLTNKDAEATFDKLSDGLETKTSENANDRLNRIAPVKKQMSDGTVKPELNSESNTQTVDEFKANKNLNTPSEVKVMADETLKNTPTLSRINAQTENAENVNLKQNNSEENIDQLQTNRDISKPSEVNYVESSRMYMQNKSFKPILNEKETKEDKYKIEITQENSEENTHEVFKKTNMSVENLLNYKSQSDKINAEVKNQTVNVADEENKKETSENSKENVIKSETKTQKASLEVKISHGNESNVVRGESGFEKILKNTHSMKEVVKTVKSSEIVQEIKTLIQAGEHKTMIIKLMPENLGKMKVIIDVADNNQMKASIEVENESAKQLIMSNVESLKQAITQSGLQLGSLSVSLTNPEGKMKREFEQKKKEQSGNADLKIEKTVTAEVKEKKLGYNTYEYLA